MFKFITLIIAILTSLTASAQGVDSIDAHHYANQTTYDDATSSPVKAPPPGYKMFFIETIGRHGARSLTTPNAETRALKVWSAASKKKALTATGATFSADVKAFQKAEKALGYGKLSTLGKAEWSGIGGRTASNYAGFFAGLQSSHDAVKFVTTPVTRTKQSASAMQAAIKVAYPHLSFAPTKADAHLVYKSGSTKTGRAAVAKIRASSTVRAAASHVLRKLYSASYVKSLSDPVGKALDIYLLYCTAPGMAMDTDVNFAKYVPLADAKVLGYAVDANKFYEFGPGASGQANTYAAAKPLLKDFFSTLDKRIAGGKTAAVFRLAHGENTIPFAALIRLPGSQTHAPKSKPYSYATNPWRGYVAGRLAGNIEWVGYRNSAGRIVVTMRYNEEPVKFRSKCKPTATAPYFYRVSTLKHCLG